MRIVHYFLGFPPYRSGGAVNYPIDLALEQSRLEHEVIMIWPGRSFPVGSPKLVKRSKWNMLLENYELVNPLPVPLLFGIRKPADFMIKTDISSLIRFFKELNPDLVHVHTLMGLPIELLEFLRESGIKVVYTTHDFYGLCPKVRFFFKNAICPNTENQDFSLCFVCNRSGAQTFLLRLYSWPFTRNHIFKFLGKSILSRVENWSISKFSKYVSFQSSQFSMENQYQKLLNYYLSMFNLIDYFLFNSTISEKIFKEKLGTIKGKVIPLSASSLNENRMCFDFNVGEKVNIIYVGGSSVEKGYKLLLDSLSELYTEGVRNFVLKLFGEYPENDTHKPYTVVQERFRRSELRNIFQRSHLLVVPSLCYETFSLITIEALSFGIPALISNRVGAKDLLQSSIPELVVEPKDFKSSLKSILQNPNKLYELRDKVLKLEIETMSRHTKRILEVYNELCHY